MKIFEGKYERPAQMDISKEEREKEEAELKDLKLL